MVGTKVYRTAFSGILSSGGLLHSDWLLPNRFIAHYHKVDLTSTLLVAHTVQDTLRRWLTLKINNIRSFVFWNCTLDSSSNLSNRVLFNNGRICAKIMLRFFGPICHFNMQQKWQRLSVSQIGSGSTSNKTQSHRQEKRLHLVTVRTCISVYVHFNIYSP